MEQNKNMGQTVEFMENAEMQSREHFIMKAILAAVSGASLPAMVIYFMM